MLKIGVLVGNSGGREGGLLFFTFSLKQWNQKKINYNSRNGPVLRKICHLSLAIQCTPCIFLS